MGKKDRSIQPAIVTLRDMPGTRVMFWAVESCPYCGETHLHLAGNLRSADPSDSLGEQPAPCDPTRPYVLTLAPRPQRNKKGKKGRKRKAWDEEEW